MIVRPALWIHSQRLLLHVAITPSPESAEGHREAWRGRILQWDALAVNGGESRQAREQEERSRSHACPHAA